MYTSELAEQVQQDIVDWSINWVEQPNEFYHMKFPVCPYARQARLQGQTTIKVYQGGSVREFISSQLTEDRKAHV